jgi:hypothetical protein
MMKPATSCTNRNWTLAMSAPRLFFFGVSPGFYMVTIGNGQQSYSGNLVVE